MIKIQKNVQLAKFTTLGIGGQAKYFVAVKDNSLLKEILFWARKNKIPWYVLGGGSNILIQDGELAALVIKMDSKNMEVKKNYVVADSGMALSTLVNKTANLGLSGLEFFIGIPGTIGGAIYKNTHWQAHYISDCLVKVQVINQSGQIKEINKNKLKFSYNYSSFQAKKLIITRAYFKLFKKPKKDLLTIIAKIVQERKITQPKGKSAGCIFKNPGDISAGKLISQSDLAGKQIGDIQISNLHANFFINKGSGRATDVLKLMEITQEKVKQKLGFDLQPEIFYWSTKK